MKTRCSVRITALALLVAVSGAQALDPHRAITQYGHTAWRVRDGDLPAPAYQITQTTDGYLWIGTQAGPVRYDGARFVPLTALTNVQLPTPFVLGLVAAADGSLWIGTPRGLSHWVNRRLINYPDRTRGVGGAMLEDRFGTLWFASLNPTPELSLCQVRSGDIRCYGRTDGIDVTEDQVGIGGLTQDRDGSFWLSTTNSVLRWKPGSESVSFPADARTKDEKLGVLVLAADPSGPLWVGIDARGTGLGLQQLIQGVIRTPVIPQFDPSTIAVQALLVDRANTLWIGTLDQGIYRIRAGRIDHFRAADGLSGDSVYWFYEDREGNLWVSTSGGIDRFRDLRVTSFSSREGLSVTETDSVLASRDGRIWIGGMEALDVLDHGRIISFKTGQGLPGHQVTHLLEDRAGQIWIGLDNTLTIYRDGKFLPVHGLHDGPLGFVDGLVEDPEGNVWVRIENKLLRIREDQVREEIPLAGRGWLVADREAGIWLMQRNGDLLRYRNGKFDKFTYNLSHHQGRGLDLMPDGTLLLTTDAGVAALKNGQQRTLTRANGLPCNDVYGSITDRQNALWLFAQCGLIEIPAEQLRQLWQRPNARIRPRLLDVFDGAGPGRAYFNVAARDPDGRLWFANGEGFVESLDPTDLLVHHPPVPVHVEGVVADHKAYPAEAQIRLDPNPRNVEIDYTALSLAVPQRVHFRYKLDGHDHSWQEPGRRRQAFYTDLAPGNYLFRVIASDSDGEWNTVGATLGLAVTPAWYQTSWFRSLGVLLGVAAIALIYRLRVRQITRGLRLRFDERLAERTRLARELHDTLLQTIQGSRMVADDALDASTDLAGMRKAMQRLSTWLTQATQEGRAALNALRASTTQENDLAEGLRAATEGCDNYGSTDVVLSVNGKTRQMHPIVRDEVYRIGCEAIRNACQHAKATRLEVSLTYARDLTVVVSDDGEGMDPTIAAQGKPGHYGIQGMRERTQRIGGNLTIASGERSGTEIRLVVPGRVIFRSPRSRLASFAQRLRGFIGR